MEKLKSIFLLYKGRIAVALFYVGLSIELLIMMFGHSAYTIPYRGRILHVAFILFGVKTLLTKYSNKEWGIIFFLGVVGVISYISMGDEWFIRIVMMVVASKDISLEKVIRYTFWIALVGTVLIVGMSFAGIGGKLVDVRDYGRGGVEARWCFGFNHANNVHGTLWYIVSLGLLSFIRKVKWYHGVLLTIGNMILYFFTISRTGFIVTELVILAAIIYAYYPKVAGWNWIYILGAVGTTFCALIGIFVVIFGVFSLPGLKNLSDLLTVRLEVLSWWESVEQWSMFGDGRERKLTDVGFITLVSEYGYVIFTIYLVALILMIFYYCRNKKWMEFIVLMTCVLYTFMESTYTINVYLLCNFTFLLLLGNWNRLLERELVQGKELV